ncbi:P-loop containing nucleoside triphosphate hydrolase protein [Trichoderma reesei RUT C-30]|uniref:p-loop containing nucleoside triphosphate hydrolase protein n=1 Tax=Hypocrea jecorina (strain ATCC 56765 / BCRC 32924 / NRRL 11460 / Rut C-30) TaxID=1344414 RepID=A0A024SK74_HYPJR|nr:P-loop containing nucleoside triphosphate hydrolase protein [Trichoderma reesei RUT C-30]
MNPLSYLIQRPFPRAWQSSFAIKLPFRVPTAYTSSRHFTTSQSLFRGRRKKRPFVPSPGQQKIVKLCAEHNVVVSARPGSGKTATAEAIVAAYPHLRVAVLCYSKALQLDTQRRLKKYPNVEAFTFHKMARLLFDAELYEDITLSQEIQNTIALNKLPHGHFEPFDIIVLDEFQDCTDLIFRLVIIFIRANEAKRLGRPSRIVVLGDERQSIYQFRGADYRYLTAAPELLGPLSPWSFAQLPLDQSFRLSKETVQFVNDAFLGGEAYISSSKSGPKPIILNCDPFDKYTLAKELLPLIKHYGAKNTAIIAPAIRNNKPLKSLANVLVEKFGVPIAEPIDEDGPLNDDVIKGKLCISTIHQFKGRERELVILSGMDASFYRYAGRHLPDDRCPNEVFVALTRAVEQLVLIHDAKQKPMPFVNLDALYKTADVINLEDKVSKIRSPDDPGRPVEYGLSLPTLIGVSDIARHARGDYLEKFSRRHSEAISDINGLVVVAAFEHDITGEISMVRNNRKGNEGKLPISSEEQIPWLCRQACQYLAQKSGYRPRLVQMKDHAFDWIEPKHLSIARGRLHGELDSFAPNLRFEERLKREFEVDGEKTQLLGEADIICVSTPSKSSETEIVESVWEIKFVSQLSNSHIVQASTYAYLVASASGQLPRIMLYNVRDGQKLEITPRNGLEGLRRMIESVLRLKFTTVHEMEDEAFMELCAKATQEVLDLDNDGAEET